VFLIIFSRSRLASLKFSYFLTQIVSVLIAASPIYAGEPDADEEEDQPARWETDVKLEMGWQRNLFEETHSKDMKSDGFIDSALGLEIPLDGDKRMLTGFFNYAARNYFKEQQLNSYSLRPSFEWQVFDQNETNLKVGLYGSRFLERIYDESQNIPNKSQPGYNLGVNWNFESKIEPKTDFIWNGNYNYQWFDQVSQDNVSPETGLEFVRSMTDNTNFRLGAKLEFQNYAKRPTETEAPGNPVGLQTLGSYLTGGINHDLGNDWRLEIGQAAGYRLDRTTGYYDAAIANSQLELSWSYNSWTWIAQTEFEWTAYAERLANRRQANHQLVSQVIVFETTLEYQVNNRLSVFGQAELRQRDTNSNEYAPDPVQNNFSAALVRLGIIFRY
jgi:hypothetical protein